MRPIIFMTFLLNAWFLQSQTRNLTIRITDIKSAKGNIQIGLYNKEEHYPHKGLEFKKIVLKAKAPVLTYTIENLPQGEYAVALYHDINNDGKINRNLLGVPKEGYGFSNNIKPFFSAPSFEKVKFSVHSDTTITISLFH